MVSEAGGRREDGIERRLHPLSWLFVMLTQLRHVALPLLALLFVGRGSWWELGGFVAAGALALYAFVYSLGFRYRLGSTEIFVREGLLGRTERHVPYARIQNIVERRNPLHRLFDVTELRLESAGGSEPEAVMNVITTAEAARIAAILRGRAAAEPAASTEAVVLALPWQETVRLGLLTNRGLVVVGALAALAFQFEPWDPSETAEAIAALAAQRAGRPADFGASAALVVLFGTGALGAAVVALKLLSIVVAVLTFHRFTLARSGERITTESGLLTRSVASARRDKVQRVLLAESWLARCAGRRRLWCEVAAGLPSANDAEGARLRWLAPIGTPETITRVIGEVAPGLDPASRHWRPLHPRARHRRFVRLAVISTAAHLMLAGLLGWWTLASWAASLALAWRAARGWATFAAYACDEGVLAFRAGWLSREWTLAWMQKGHVARLDRSPFDRRHGMASVTLDTAGAGSSGLTLRVPYLDEEEARALLGWIRAKLQENDEPRSAADYRLHAGWSGIEGSASFRSAQE